MSRLPYDDEQELDQETLDLINGDNLDEPNLGEDYVRSQYMANSDTSDQMTPSVDLTGQIVGQSRSPGRRDPFERLNQLVPQQQVEQAAPMEIEQPVANPQTTSYENILKQLQEQRKENNLTVNMARAGNQIAQAIASGYGGKIGDGSEALNAIERSNNQDVADYQEQIKNQMDDPSSAISKYYRLQVLKQLKEQDPKADLSQFDTMSANQLKDITANKAKTGRGDLFFTTRFNDKTGKSEIVGVNRTTGEVQTSLGERSFGDKIIKDTETGKNQIYSQNTGIKGIGAGTPEILKTEPVNEEEIKKQQEVLNSPTSLKKVNPDLYKKFSDNQKTFIKDSTDLREATSAITNLNQKLAPGKVKIDSGMLGGIQTQAAKLAGQKGVLTDQDLVKFAGAGGVPAGASRWFSGNFNGEMTEQDIKFFKEFSNNMAKAIAEDVKNRSQFFIKTIHNEAKDYVPGLSEQNVSKWLNIDSVAPAAQQEMVKVISPNGKTGSIPKENLEKALSKGYKEVK